MSDPQDLLKETHNFYKSLSSTEPCEVTARRQFLNDEIPKLPDNAQESCEGVITEQELCKAVENNKSPGIDGLTTNFINISGPL